MEYSVQQLVDCNTEGQYGCRGGWMLEAFDYIHTNGILLKEDYREYSHSSKSCQISDAELAEKNHIKNIGYIEHDKRTNDQLKELLMSNPVSSSIKTSGKLQNYRSGILTEDYLKCSDPSREVDHGILIVGFGRNGALP